MAAAEAAAPMDGQPDGEDRIALLGLRVLGNHGVASAERLIPQPFEVDLDLMLDLRPAGQSDDLTQTVDYGAVLERVGRVVAEQSFSLIEALAEAIAVEVLSDPRVVGVSVSVRKLRPPVAVDVASVAVRITRRARLAP
jgi:dihydroneopterin aldolase